MESDSTKEREKNFSNFFLEKNLVNSDKFIDFEKFTEQLKLLPQNFVN